MAHELVMTSPDRSSANWLLWQLRQAWQATHCRLAPSHMVAHVRESRHPDKSARRHTSSSRGTNPFAARLRAVCRPSTLFTMFASICVRQMHRSWSGRASLLSGDTVCLALISITLCTIKALCKPRTIGCVLTGVPSASDS